ncbi:MAG: acyltransferase family protein [Phycisphaerales bacterium]|nr:MAG: acyltransferase family protein [Phycisphaerales bacterium]
MQQGQHIAFIDNPRIFLTISVISLHLAVTYGGPGFWPYVECTADIATFSVFAVHNAVSQSFVMSLFFLTAGYFTVASYERKGPRLFTRDRLLRLGIPLLCYDFVINPSILFLLRIKLENFQGSYLNHLWDYLNHGFYVGSGPLWSVERLLLFTLCYLLYRLIFEDVTNRLSENTPPPSNRITVLFAAIMGVLLFIKRIRLPILENVDFLTLSFPSLPLHHICFFIIGIVSYRTKWLQRITKSAAKFWLKIVAVFVLVCFPLLLIIGGALSGDTSQYFGGLRLQSLFYSIWDQFVGLGMIIVLLYLFGTRFNRPSAITASMAKASYATYIIHGFVIVGFTLTIRNIQLHALPKYLLAAVVSIPLCFTLAHLIRKLPLVNRIL